MAADRLILRFSDRERDSIAAHGEVIGEKRYVWWGWWKKDHESFPPSGVLPEGQLDPPLEVGLLKRKPDEAFWIGTCTAVTSLGGDRMDSPDSDATPSYYAQDRFPAWFKFAEFRRVSADEFVERFSGVPEADATLYWVEGPPERAKMLPELAPPRQFSTDGETILHLSDLHFGDYHAFDEGWEPKPMVEMVCERVEELGIRIGVVVVSGDLISRAKHESYPQAQQELEKLLGRLGLEKRHIVIVPGNHDIDLDEAADEKATRTYSHEKGFRDFLDAFYGAEVPEIETLTRYRTNEGWDLNFVGLNSVRLREPATKDFGYVGHRSRPWMKRLRELHDGKGATELTANRTINFAVLHHHLLPANREAPFSGPVSVTVDAAAIVEDCLNSAVHVALHGHQHYPFIANTLRVRASDEGAVLPFDSPLWVIGAGSCGARPEQLTNDLRENSFGIYTPVSDGLEVEIDKFNPTQSPTPFRRLTVPLAGP